MNHRKLQTVKNSINTICALGDPVGGVYYHYFIECCKNDSANKGKLLSFLSVTFQKGERSDPDSLCGVTDSDLLEIVKDRLMHFAEQSDKNNSYSEALLYVALALEAMKRV